MPEKHTDGLSPLSSEISRSAFQSLFLSPVFLHFVFIVTVTHLFYITLSFCRSVLQCGIVSSLEIASDQMTKVNQWAHLISVRYRRQTYLKSSTQTGLQEQLFSLLIILLINWLVVWSLKVLKTCLVLSTNQRYSLYFPRGGKKPEIFTFKTLETESWLLILWKMTQTDQLMTKVVTADD